MENSSQSENRQSRSRKRNFLEESKQTDRDRRSIRRKEREFYNNLKENASELTKLTSSQFQASSNELDQIYQDVCYPREANLDASNLSELNSAVAKQCENLGASDLTKYEATDLIRSSRELYMTSGVRFDWYKLGTAAGACFTAVPETNFLFGLMNTEVVEKTRAPRVRRSHTDESSVPESQPSEYTSKKDRRDAQARRLEVLQSYMMESKKEDLFRVVVNPRSFTQTVENLFDVSFLVRNGDIEIGMDEEGHPYLENHEGRNDEYTPAQAQSIISLTPSQWEEIMKNWNIDEPKVGHRTS